MTNIKSVLKFLTLLSVILTAVIDVLSKLQL
jgi:hypothetical protein